MPEVVLRQFKYGLQDCLEILECFSREAGTLWGCEETAVRFSPLSLYSASSPAAKPPPRGSPRFPGLGEGPRGARPACPARSSRDVTRSSRDVTPLPPAAERGGAPHAACREAGSVESHTGGR